MSPDKRLILKQPTNFRIDDNPGVGRQDQYEGLRLAKIYAFVSAAIHVTLAFSVRFLTSKTT
jgi:hypothetical protein